MESMQAMRKEGVELGRGHDPCWKVSLLLWQILIPCPEPRHILSRPLLPPICPAGLRLVTSYVGVNPRSRPDVPSAPAGQVSRPGCKSRLPLRAGKPP